MKMIKAVRMGAALAMCAGGLAAARAAPGPAPASQAQIDAQIMQACRTKGGKPSECACGLRIAKEELTPRQMALVPILWPIVESKADTMTKVSRGLAAAQTAGYQPSEALQAVFAVQNQTARTQKECKGGSPARP